MPSLSDKHPNPAVDNFITALADKHSPFNKHVPVNFKQVADKAKTIEREGELSYLALGSTGSEERKSVVDSMINIGSVQNRKIKTDTFHLISTTGPSC